MNKIEHYKLGFEIGKKYSNEIKHAVKKFSNKLSLNKALLVRIEKEFPNYFEELKGIAEGSKTNFDKLLKFNCEDINFRKGCSTIVLFKKRLPIVGHNEDTSRKEATKKIGKLLKFKFSDNEFTAFMYFGELVGNSFGWNKKGLFLCMDYIYGINKKNFYDAVPMYFIFRSVLDSKNIDDALTIFKKYSVSTGYHCLIRKNKEVFSIEKLHNHTDIQKVNDNFFHTNFFISSKFTGKDKPKLNSIKRYRTIAKLIKMKSDLKKILLDNSGSPNAICGGKKDNLKTLASIIINSKNKIRFYKEYK